MCYECAVHTQLTYQSQMQSCSFVEAIEPGDWPSFGRFSQGLSYEDLGLLQQDFRSATGRSLSDELKSLAIRSDRIQVFGFAHMTGDGIHDIHQNSGEGEHSARLNRPGQDGALVFYNSARPGVPAHRIWWCLKFERQNLP